MKKLLFLFVALASATFLHAYDFQSGDLYYEITSDSTVMVTSKSASYPYNDGVTITSAIIPSTVSYGGKTFAVTAVDDDAFYKCTSLASVAIPTTVTSIGSDAFYGTSLYNNSSKWENDVLYIGDCLIEAKNTLSGSYTIKSNTRLVASSAFYKCTSLTSITIPENVQLIGRSCFHYCESLAKVVWNAKKCTEFYKNGNAGNYLFSNTPVTSFVFGEGVEHIPGSICYGLEILTSITIPASVTSIGDHAFNGCYMLNSLVLGNNVTTIGRSAFYKCSSLASVTIPNSVTDIGSYAFYNCSSLASVTIPENVTEISSTAFSGCSSLTDITWNVKNYANISSSSSSPFYNIRSQIASFKFGDKVQSIPDYLCYGMDKLPSISIPNNVTTIGNFAFSGCSSLSSITIPENITYVGKYAFNGCSSLTVVMWNAKNCEIVATGSPYAQTTPFYGVRSQITSFTFGDGVVNIPNWLCYEMEKLTSIVIPYCVTNVGYGTFSRCSSITSVVWNAKIAEDYQSKNYAPFENSPIYNFVFGDGVQHIPAFLCYNLSSLPTITIPQNIKTIGKNAFGQCVGLTSVEWNPVTCIGYWDTEYAYPIFSGCKNVESFVFGDNVQEIPKYLCYQMSKITSLALPQSLNTIGFRAFKECSSLTAITIPESVKTIDGSAFDACTSLNKTNYTGDVASWCNIKFANTAANPINYSHNFYINNQEIKDLVIPGNTGDVKFGVFFNCTSLSSITILDGVTNISKSAFNGCSSVSKLVLGESLVNIGDYAFSKCSSLSSLVLPASVESIGDSTFYNCTSLSSITAHAVNPSTIGNNALYGVKKTIPVYVPCENVETYKSADGWKEFSNIQEQEASYSISVNTLDAVMGSASVDKNTVCGAQISAMANEGYIFKQWSDGNTDNPRTLVLDKDTSLIAEFEVEQKSCLIASGICGLNGDNLTWQLSCDSILTIMGTGNMSEYSNDINQPWKEHASMIKSIVIKEGVTSIGANAFYNYSTAKYNSLKDITIPGTLTKTGAHVFSGITSMESVYITDLEAWMDITHANSGGNPLSVAHHLYVNGVELTELVVPDGVKTIKKYVFCGCEGLKSLQLPSSLTLIDNSAFLGTGLTNLVLPEGLKIVDNSAFYNCNSLETIHISSTVQRLGNCSFEICKNLKGVYIKDLEAWCKMEMEYSSPLKTAHHLYLNNVELTEVDFPKSCTVVKDFAFEGCSYIKTIKLHAGITSISSFAFDGCFALDSIVIPDSVTYIGSSALGDCSSMKKIEFLATTPPKIISGAQAFSGNDAEFVVPCGSKDDYIAAINIENKQAFWIDSLRFVEKLPSMYTYSITTSNEYQGSVAYLQRPTYCDDLTLSFRADANDSYIFKQWSDGNTDNPRTLILDKDTTLTAEFIQLDSTRCIFYTSTDGNIVIPDDPDAFGATIVSNTYENGQGVILFDAPVTSIGMNAFVYASLLESIIIPSSVDSIKGDAFRACTSLESIKILEGCKDIGYRAIYDCPSLRSIIIPKSLTSIARRNFRECISLITIDVENENPNYSSDNGILFDKTKTTLIKYPAGLQDTTYTIPNYVKTIGEEAFMQCGALHSINIPNSVTSIGGGAFANCPSLVSMVIPNSVTDVGGGLFYNCSALKDVVLSENMTALSLHDFQIGYDGHGFFEGCLSLDSIFIPSSVTRIYSLAFKNCSRITTITIPENVTYVGGDLFGYNSSLTSIIWNAKNCSNPSYLGEAPFYPVRSQITSFVLGDKVENIPSYLYWGMDKIDSLTIPNSTTSIGDEVFVGCSSLDTIDVKPYIPPILGKNVFDEGLVCNIHCGTLTAYESSEWVNQVDTFIEQPCEDGTKIFYTSSDGKVVTPYNLDAFGATIVSNIYQDGVGVITCDAPIQTIGNNAFKYCSTLTSITLPNEVVNLGASAFNGCISLASFTIPEKITYLPPCVFQSCQSLKSIVIPNNVISIGFQAFTSCTSLDSLIIPNSVENLEPCAFLGCSSLRYVLLGDGLTSIGGSAFASCFSLTSITIPKGITSIGNSAFENCSSIATIASLPQMPPTASYSVFGGISKTIPIYVPCGTVAAYQSAEGWKEFTNIQEPLTEYSISITAQNDVMGSTSIDKNTACATIISAAANYGYLFKQWSDGNIDNPRTLILNQDAVLTAEFERNAYTISTAAFNSEGITLGDTTALYLDSVIISAIANPGYRFVYWSDGSAENPRKVQVTEDKLYTAHFTTKSFVHNTIREYVCDNTEYINPITNQAVLISSTNPASLTWVDTILSDLTDSIYTFVITPIVPPTMLNDSVLSTLQGALPVLKQGEQPIVETSVAAITTYYKLTDTEAIADVTRVIWQKSDTIIPCDATIYTMILHLEDACGNVEEREFVFDVEERSIRVEETFASICNGESYIWSSNGKQYDNSGEYYDTLRLVNGCDELIRVLHLTVLPPMKTDTINLELSISELPYDWHGHTLMKMGTYTTREQYANVDCDSIEYILNLTIRPLDIPISITPPMAVCGNPIDVSITTEELENYIAETMFDAMDEMTIIWQVKINGEWEILTDATLKGNTDEVVVRYVIYAAWGNVESPEMTISVQMPTPDNDVKRDGIATVSRYNNRIFLFHLNDFEAKYGWIPNPEQIVWYKVVDDVDEYGTAGDDVVVGVGHHYNLPDGAPIEGDYYGLVMQSDARVDANGCTGVYRTVVLRSSKLLNPRLVPNLAHPNEILTLENLNPSEVSEIRVYSITGELITTYVAEQVSEFMFSAHHILGYYMVDVITGDDKVTLKYVVQ